MPTFTKTLFIIAAGLIVLGLLWWVFGRWLGWLGRLPGDIRVEGENGGFYFPITTCILISVVGSLLLALFRKIFGE